MKRIIIKYGSILSALYLINNYMQIIPVIDRLIDESLSGWIAIMLLISMTLIGINEYIKIAYNANSYEYIKAVITGAGINFLASVIFSVVSTIVLLVNNIEFDLFQVLLTRIFKYTIIGLIVSLIIPFTFKSKID
jgi:hypothetical protein